MTRVYLTILLLLSAYGNVNARKGICSLTHNRMEDSMESVAKKLEEMDQRIMAKLDEVTCGGFIYRGVCYWAVITGDQDAITFDKGVETCRKKSGKTADIVDSNLYSMVVGYVRSIMSTTSFKIWTGMIYNPSDKSVHLSSGTAAAFTKYHPDATTPEKSGTKMGIRIDNFYGSDGIYSIDPTTSQNGVLCQK
ncbi:uncharacterized protein LOC120343204 [Styela clava]